MGSEFVCRERRDNACLPLKQGVHGKINDFESSALSANTSEKEEAQAHAPKETLFFCMVVSSQPRLKMQVKGIAVTALTAVVSVFVLAWALIQRKRYKWPKGYNRTTAVHKGYKVTVLTSKKGEYSRELKLLLASDCARAVRALLEAYPQKTEELAKAFRHTVCWFKTDADFEETVASWNSYDPSLPSAHTTTIPKEMSGGGLLGATVRERLIGSVRGHGQPWAHELTHHLSSIVDKDWDHGHEKTELWVSLKERFHARYLEIKRGA
jgi:hypothetical protein